MKLVFSTLLATGLLLPSLAEARMFDWTKNDELAITTGVDVVSEYVFRGASLAEDAIQPYAELTKGNVTVGAWASTGFGAGSEASNDEIDLYINYSLPLDRKAFTIDLSAQYYHYPQNGALFESANGNAGSYELGVALGFTELPFTPKFSAYYDLTLEAVTATGELGESLELSRTLSLGFDLTVGLVESDAGLDYQWVQGGAKLAHAFSENVSAYAGANYVFNSESVLDFEALRRGQPTDDELFWTGVGISAGF